MKIALINGSPKVNNSASGELLKDVKDYIEEKIEIIEINIHKPMIINENLEQLKKVDALVISCPLYVDGIPGHLLSSLVQLEKSQWENKKINVYGIVNCGFYEGIQAQYALKILENWCLKVQLSWSGGIGIGGGGALSQMPSTKKGHGPRGPVDNALKELTNNILQGTTQPNNYISVAFPRFLYRIAAQLGWRQLIKSNGGKVKDLGKQWTKNN